MYNKNCDAVKGVVAENSDMTEIACIFRFRV